MRNLFKRALALIAAGCVVAANGVCFAMPASAAQGGSFQLTGEFVSCDELINTSGGFINLGISGGTLQAGWTDAPDFAKTLYSGVTLTISDDGSFTCALPQSGNGKKTSGDHTDEDILVMPIPAITFTGQIKDYQGGIAYWNDRDEVKNYYATATVTPNTWDLSRRFVNEYGEERYHNEVWTFNTESSGASMSTYYNAELDMAYVILSVDADVVWSNNDFPEGRDSYGDASFYFSVQHPAVADLRTETDSSEESGTVGGGTQFDSSSEDDSLWIIQNESRNALESAGEDSGTEIDAELVTGKKKHRDDDSSDNAKKGAAAATGAAVAAVTATTSVTSSRKKKVIYKMYINKDFGNGIPVGRPVYLYARIAKYENGSAVGVTDAELTQKISIDFDLPPRYNEKLRSCVQAKKLYGVQNGYARFAVLISDNTATSVLADDELPLTVKFIFTGKGGILTECVRFRMMGKPTAQLMLKTNSGFIERIGREHISAFLGRTYKDIPETQLLLGDSRPYSLYVKAKNFLYPAESIKLAYENADGSLNGRYTVTPVRVDNDIFELKIDNRTVASDDKCGEKPYVDGGFSVTLTNSHDEKGELYLPVQFYHEGIFAYCSHSYPDSDRFKRACVEYHTNEIDENKLEHLRKTLIRICGAFRIEGASKDSESIVYLTEKPVKLSTELVGRDDEMKKILKNISTDITLEENDDISLRPKRVLLADDPMKEYSCELAVTVQKHDGSPVSGNIPLLVIGEPRNGEVYSWNQEVEFTKNMITLYNIKSLSDVRFDMWIKELYNHRFSPTELSLIRHRLYDIGVELEHERIRLAMNEAAFWDKCVMIAEAVKFADDIAFTITVRAIAITILKKNPMYVEPVANAIKKFMEDVAAEWSMGKLDEQAIIKILMDTTFTFFEDLFINFAMLPDPYALITLFVLASSINFGRHAVVLSMDKNNRNMGQTEILCKALTNCVIDMTVKGVVIAITKVLEKKVPGLSKFVEGDNIDVVIKNKKVTVDASGQIMKMLTKGHTFKGVWRNATLKQEILNICAEYALPGVMKMDDGHTWAIPFPSFSGTPDEEKMIDEAYDQMLAMNNTVSITMPGTDITLPVPKDLISIAVTTKLLDSLGMSKVMDFFDAVKTVKPPERFEYIPPRKLNESLIEYGWKKEADRLNEGLTML